MMKQFLWIGLLASATSADTALSSFEFWGGGYCTYHPRCSSYHPCMNSFFFRGTDSQYRSTNTEDCAREALNVGAQGFTVSPSTCRLHPQQDPGLPNHFLCHQSPDCPAPSPYGSYGSSDWTYTAYLTKPILGIWPQKNYSCYRLTEPAPSENPTENPTEGCCEALTAECLSCQLGVTLEEFCTTSPSTPGCTPVPTEKPTENPTEDPTENPTENPTEVCCKETTAECLSCFIGVTKEEFCADSPCTRGCSKEPVCCEALTAECLSCQLGLTVEEFCNASPSTPGCEDSCREYRHKGSCRKQRNCIWKKVDKKCMTG